MKKIVSTLLVVVILLNFIFCGNVQAEDTSLIDDIQSDTISAKALEELISASMTTFGGTAVPIGMSALGFDVSAVFGVIGGLLARFLNIFPHLIRALMAITIGEFFTIEKAVFNEIELFDIDYFTIGNSSNSIVNSIRNSVAQSYYIFRLLAIAISLLVLIYVGIRMALSTLSADKAKYKNMLISWAESIILLFFMQYIIALIIGIGNIFGDFMNHLRGVLQAGGGSSFEENTLTVVNSQLLTCTGWTYACYSIVYWFLVFMQTKFYLMYFKRVVVVGFLIFIAPIITITYPIDKVGDGKAQSFSVWSHELIMNIAIQPIHAIIYLVFIYTAGEIANTSIWVALVFLLVLTKVEKIILQLFNLKNVGSLKPIGDQKSK